MVSNNFINYIFSLNIQIVSTEHFNLMYGLICSPYNFSANEKSLPFIFLRQCYDPHLQLKGSISYPNNVI